jgi:phosphoribosylaminoimidazole-succinocarboxamide synthase
VVRVSVVLSSTEVTASLLTPLYRYEKSQTIHGLPQPAGLSRCQRLSRPIYTPSTKAELGQKDVNISPAQARAIVGDKYASRIEDLVLACYKAGAAYAEECGILIVSPLFACRDFSPYVQLLGATDGARTAQLQNKPLVIV